MQQLDLDKLLDQIMDKQNLYPVFQPILALDKQTIYAYEGLIRGPETSPLHRPDDLFAAASRRQCLSRLDLLCCNAIIRRYAELRLPGKLFLNVSPGSFSEKDFNPEELLSSLQDSNIDPRRIVVEITENQQVKDPFVFKTALQRLKNMGFKLALDDLGAGFSGLQLWHVIDPDYVKIDRHFIQTAHEDRVKQLFIKLIVEIADSLECKVIAEGVESKYEYTALRKLGVKLAQGYYFEEPHAIPKLSPDIGVFSQRPIRNTTSGRPSAACLLRPSPFVSPETRIEIVGGMFEANMDINSIPVVDKGEPIGLVLRAELMNLLASRFGRALHGRKPIKDFIHSRPIQVEKDMPLEEASKHITNALNQYTKEFIITDKGEFVGMGDLLVLLRRITEVQVNYARYANPLTLLPGNVLIQETLREILNAPEAFAVAYYDLDNFKAFNDAYGYGHGDEVIRMVGRLLQEHAEPENDFVGHIGGDDFIVLFRSTDWQQRCKNMLKIFNSLIASHYSLKDRARGFIESTDRFGICRSFPIMTLSVGAVLIQSPHEDLSLEQIQEIASAAKSQAKKNTAGVVFVETYTEHPQGRQTYSKPLNPHKPGFCPIFLPDTTSSQPSGEVRLP